MKYCVSVYCVMLLLLLTIPGEAQVPRTINYQGSLKQTDGTPVDSAVDMQFALYDDLDDGNLLWTETQTVTVSAGIYSVILGASVSLDDLAFDQPYYLEVAIWNDGTSAYETLTPRQALTSVPYAHRAASVDHLVVSENYGIENIRIPLSSNGFFQVGDVDMTTLTLQGNSLNLYGTSTATYYPVFSMGNGDQRAMYLWGVKDSKWVTLNLDNDHHFEIRGTSLGFNTNYSRFEISSDEVERVMDLKISYGVGMTFTGYNGDVGLFVDASNGSIGIKTTSPQYDLDVAGTIRGTTVTTSDARLKDEITNLDSALARITQLRGIRFRPVSPGRSDVSRTDAIDRYAALASARRQPVSTNPADNRLHLGVVAQEVEQVFPEAVFTDGNGYKSVAYDMLVAPLIEAVKELNVKNETLTAEIEELRAQHEELERRLKALEAAMQ